MTLDQWLTKQGMTPTEFAALANLRKQDVYNYRHSLRFPRPEKLRAIRTATEGQVTADDFVDARRLRTIASSDAA